MYSCAEFAAHGRSSARHQPSYYLGTVTNQAPKDPAGGSNQRLCNPSMAYHWPGNPGEWRSRDWIIVIMVISSIIRTITEMIRTTNMIQELMKDTRAKATGIRLSLIHI